MMPQQVLGIQVGQLQETGNTLNNIPIESGLSPNICTGPAELLSSILQQPSENPENQLQGSENTVDIMSLISTLFPALLPLHQQPFEQQGLLQQSPLQQQTLLQSPLQQPSPQQSPLQQLLQQQQSLQQSPLQQSPLQQSQLQQSPLQQSPLQQLLQQQSSLLQSQLQQPLLQQSPSQQSSEQQTPPQQQLQQQPSLLPRRSFSFPQAPPYYLGTITDSSQKNKVIPVTPEIVRDIFVKCKSIDEETAKISEECKKLKKQKERESTWIGGYKDQLMEINKIIKSQQMKLWREHKKLDMKEEMLQEGFEKLKREKKDFEAIQSLMQTILNSLPLN